MTDTMRLFTIRMHTGLSYSFTCLQEQTRGSIYSGTALPFDYPATMVLLLRYTLDQCADVTRTNHTENMCSMKAVSVDDIHKAG